MSDVSWDDYNGTGEVDPAVVDEVLPLVDAAATDAYQADAAADWSDWHGEIATEASGDAVAELEYAQDAYATGFDGAGDAALARAEIYADRAEGESTYANDYGDLAASETDAAVGNIDLAIDAVAESTSYDAVSYDTSYDTTSYDTPVADTSVDTASYDTTSYDTSMDTSSYDTSSYDDGSV